jgi:hypothetical protein
MLARNLQPISGVEQDRQWTTSRAMEKAERRAFPLFWPLDVRCWPTRDERGRTGEGGQNVRRVVTLHNLPPFSSSGLHGIGPACRHQRTWLVLLFDYACR